MNAFSPAVIDDLPVWERRIIGRGTREWVIRRMDCPELASHGLRDITHLEAGPMFRLVRKDWPLFMVIVCASGQGRVRCAGEDLVLRAGHALLVPQGTPYDLMTDGPSWIFSMLNYDPGCWSGRMPVTPRCVPLHAQPVESMIEAFYREHYGDRDPVVLRQMVDILHAKMLRLANPQQTSGRLWPVWRRVMQAPAEPWDVGRLSALAHVSDEHLRRLSR